jgi:putative acetyltransferase
LTDISVRAEAAGDEQAIARVNDEAFGQPDESRIVAAIRAARYDTISLVAVTDNEIVGHILFTPLAVEPGGLFWRPMALGPMAVTSQWQRRGVGSRLVETGLRDCARAGADVIVVIGHPEFYPRFGFRPASAFGLRSEYDVPPDVFMALEVIPNALRGNVDALVKYVPEFGTV